VCPARRSAPSARPRPGLPPIAIAVLVLVLVALALLFGGREVAVGRVLGSFLEDLLPELGNLAPGLGGRTVATAAATGTALLAAAIGAIAGITHATDNRRRAGDLGQQQALADLPE